MIIFDVWNILGIISLIGLAIFYKGKNSIWGGVTIGVFLGLIIALYYYFKGDGFSWQILKKTAIVFTLLGLASELLGRMTKRK